MVIGPNPETSTQTESSTKAAVKCACLAEAGCHLTLTQASNTPFLTTPLFDLFGILGQSHVPSNKCLKAPSVPPGL